MNNLKNSFPQKTEKEIQLLTKQFYKHFADVIFETIKLISMSDKELKAHTVYTAHAQELFKEFVSKNLSFVAVLGHCGNWEWVATAYQLYSTQPLLGVYHPLSNKEFDALMLKLRNRNGAIITPMQRVYRKLIELHSQQKSVVVGLIADQAAPPESSYWTTFLNQDTAVFNGAETMAYKLNIPLMYVHVKKTKRFYYEVDLINVSEKVSGKVAGELTAAHVKSLEKNILIEPHLWLWTHKRWKHKKPAQSNI